MKDLKNKDNKLDNDPLVSIIIPIYNGAKYAKAAIDSALSQTYKNTEIIVVNDGSKDRGATDSIAKAYGNKIKYYYKDNGGVSTALNFAIDKMQGKYFSWLSHDDTYEPNKIAAEIEYLRENKLLNSRTIVYSDYYLIDESGNVLSECIKNHDELTRKPEYAMLKGNINGLSLLIPKKAFNEHGVFDTTLKCTQDYELWRKMARTYNFVHIPKLLVNTRYHSKQVSNTSPLVKIEGNALYLGLMGDVSFERKNELEGSEYCFYEELANFYKDTPYNKAEKFCRNRMKKLLTSVKKATAEHKVSVIIPFYNRNKEVVRAFKSVVGQTHKNLEVILVDDGSDDDISEVEKIISKHNTATLIRLSKNSGVSTARNIGINKATGEYIAFLDSDDKFLPKKIETQLAYMLVSNTPISHTSYTRNMDGVECFMHSSKYFGHCERSLMGGCPIATPTVMLDAKWLKQSGLKFDEYIGIGEDTILWLQIVKHNYLIGIDEPLTVVFAKESSSAYDANKQIIGLKNIIRFLLNDDYYTQYNLELSYLMQDYVRRMRLEKQSSNYGSMPNYGGPVIIRSIRKFGFFLRHEGLKNALIRTAKKLNLLK